jgi:hypothetical protein
MSKKGESETLLTLEINCIPTVGAYGITKGVQNKNLFGGNFRKIIAN